MLGFLAGAYCVAVYMFMSPAAKNMFNTSYPTKYRVDQGVRFVTAPVSVPLSLLKSVVKR